MHMHFKQHVINNLNCLPLQLLHSNALIMIIKFYLIFRYNNMMLIQVLIALLWTCGLFHTSKQLWWQRRCWQLSWWQAQDICFERPARQQYDLFPRWSSTASHWRSLCQCGSRICPGGWQKTSTGPQHLSFWSLLQIQDLESWEEHCPVDWSIHRDI